MTINRSRRSEEPAATGRFPASLEKERPPDFSDGRLFVSGLETVPNGFRIRYQKCDIYYADAIGVHEVYGDIQAKYNASGTTKKP